MHDHPRANSIYSPRFNLYIPKRVVLPPLLKHALAFVPVTVLTAIITQMILSPYGTGLELTWRNSQLVAASVAILVCAITHRQLLTIAVGLAVFFCWQF
ncbi:MAG: AzlD domain-containing protein [Glaciimonas sp.]|nr:AzlD domain-containing protein [Glaciimonas sp.]